MTRAAELAAVRLALEAEKCRRSFRAFVTRYWPVVTGAPLDPNRAIESACAVLQRVGDGELRRVLIAMPSGIGKSTLLVLFKGWRFARDPSHRTIAMMHAASLANTESLRLRRLVEGDEFTALFPNVRLRADEQRVDAWATTRDGRHYAVGVDSSLLGRRAKEAILDDPLDVLSRFSRAAKEALWAWFSESLMSRLDGDDAPVIVVHQRLCVDDLIGRLLESGGWYLLELPAEDDEGALLAPTILSREKLDELKQRNPRAYASMFLQRPSADDGAAIARTAWRFHAPRGANPLAARPSGCAKPEDTPTVETPRTFGLTVISCDMTFGGTRTSNDRCSIQVWSAAADGPGRYLRARWAKRATQRDQREQIKAFNREYPGAVILIEKAAGGAGAIEELIAEGITNIVPIAVGVNTGGKQARLDTVSPTIDLGLCYLPLGMADLGGFVEELAGSSRHDDDMDACSMAIHHLNTNTGSGADLVEQMRAANANLAAILRGERQADPAVDAEHAAAIDAARQRRRDRLDRLAAREAAGDRLSRGERTYLRMHRRPKRAADTTSTRNQDPGEP